MQQNPEPHPSNKRKATDPPTHTPHTAPALHTRAMQAPNAHTAPAPAPATAGPQFFPKNFASPEMMPKMGSIPSLEYLASLTPSRTSDATAALLVQEDHSQMPLSAPLHAPDEMKIFDSLDSQQGLDASMHTPTAEVPDEDDNESFIQTLAILTESGSGATVIPRPNLHFTLPPPGGFPLTHRGQAAEFMLNLYKGTAKAWLVMAAPKFFVRFYDYNGKDTSKHTALVTKLQKSLEIIAAHEGLHGTSFKISPPCAPPTPNATASGTFLVYEIPQQLSDTVLAQRVWSVPQITFEAYPFEPKVIPSIMLCLAGYIYPDDGTVVDSIKTTWSQPAAIETLVGILVARDPKFSGTSAHTQAETAIQDMIQSVRSELLDLKAQGGTSSPQWNIYVTSPTSRVIAWSKIQKYIYTLTYPSSLSGTGVCRNLFTCKICHSYNHPRSLCPFPNIQGWNGPQHSERTTDAPARHPGRGRGRGRGRPNTLV